jgi:indolepyruvate ferredoxin oxidoreductase alpha subunit
MKHLMSGNEATARGVYEAGIKVCSAYPGTPSTEILENLPQYGKDVYCEWAPNEKVATEVAYGAAMAGSRSFCTMKMVGLNVAADPLFTAGYLGVNGAYIVVSADDPSCHSSQNEQDNRLYARAAKVAMVEPSDSQECKDFVKLACEISEEFDTPVLYRTTTRVCHSKGLVEFGERTEHAAPTYQRNVRKFVCTPAHAYMNHPIVEERLAKLAEYGCTRALENGLNKLELGDGKVGVITASISYQYAKEVFPEGTSFLKLGLTFPLPMDLIRDFAKKVEKLYVIEELEPFMEEQIKAAGIDCVGKELTGNMYELNTELVRERVLGVKPSYQVITEVQAAKRPPALCPGCPHRGFFYTLSKNKNYVVTGDIGCYTLGSAAPLNCMDACLCMGGGFTVGMGIAKSFQREGVTGKVVFGVMGDSTFFHSGMTGAAEIIYNNGRMIPCVLDNRITGMTGHQDNPGTGFTLMGEPAPMIRVEGVLEAYGFAPVFTVDPQDLKAMKQTVDAAVAALNEGKHPAIVTRRPCLLIKRMKHENGMCVVNADKCRSCKSCLKVGCPSISMENGKAFIDRTQCVGCTVCAQACPFGAIEKEEK